MEDIEKKDKRTILVVDDEKPIVEILVYNLQNGVYVPSSVIILKEFYLINRKVKTHLTFKGYNGEIPYI